MIKLIIFVSITLLFDKRDSINGVTILIKQFGCVNVKIMTNYEFSHFNEMRLKHVTDCYKDNDLEQNPL